MIVEDVPILKIQKLSKEQYDQIVENDALEKGSLYLTPKADLINGKVPTAQLPDNINYGTVSVNKGGTGATDAVGARTNLGITPANIGAATATDLNNLKNLVGTTAVSTQIANASLNASKITSGTLSSDRLPVVPIAKGGTGANNATTARTNLGLADANIALIAATSKQKGTYTGNGSATTRTITTNGKGTLMIIMSEATFAIVSSQGAFCKNGSKETITGSTISEARATNGSTNMTLTISSGSSSTNVGAFNLANRTYTWYIL